MPALQRTVAEPELVTDPSGFRDSLDTWRDSSFLTPLGHLVSPEAPSGLGHGLATPGGTVGGGPDTPTVSRVFDLPRSGGGGGDVEPSGAPTVALQRVAGLSVVEPLISARPPAMRIRQLPVQRAVPDTDTTPPAVQRRSAAPTPPTPPRPLTVGLGEPLAGLPPTAQRTPAASTGAVPLDEPGGGAAEAEQAEVSRPLLGDDPLEVRTADSEPVPPTSPAPPAPPAPIPAAPHLPPRSLADWPPAPIQRASAAGTPVAEVPPAPAAGPVVPLVAQRSVPLFSGVLPPSVDGPSGGSPSAAAEPPVVPVRWSDPNDEPLAGRAVGVSGVPSAQRSVASAAAPPPPSVSRVTAGPSKPPGGRLVDAGAVAIAAGVAQRMADGSVVFQPPSPGPPSSRPSAPPSPAPPPSVARAATPAIPSVPLPPPVQRDSENTEPPPPEPEPEPAPEPPQASEAATPPAPTTHDGKGGPPKVDDELVRALYAPLSRLLKAELRLERERAGFLINTRH
ncbi:hypothetical protein B7755_005085 [Streptomyces sp. NBS 14/10]|uniref:hypothetical protein n=1 Tax=Streptomyces sp. NBS 14/10 TaxID=1945643 RepID=UPI0015C690F2|nr:hypothetical protein [Streptomyces sp. NBS 14/10]KAK1177597.1 hypothetical protein B7755_005085 [Streptomyces sp. NBS 14/10]